MALIFGQKQTLKRGMVRKLLSLCGLDNVKNGHHDGPAGNHMKTPACPTGKTAEIELTAE
jgi:hypothetical protein